MKTTHRLAATAAAIGFFGPLMACAAPVDSADSEQVESSRQAATSEPVDYSSNPIYSGYLGCFADGSTRALPTLLIGSGATIETCTQAAFGAGLRYAGLQWYGQCFGGNTLGYAQLPEASCSTPCSSASGEICGGSWVNSVFDVRGNATGFTSSECWYAAGNAATGVSDAAILSWSPNAEPHAYIHTNPVVRSFFLAYDVGYLSFSDMLNVPADWALLYCAQPSYYSIGYAPTWLWASAVYQNGKPGGCGHTGCEQ